jgi:hypothetical protein
MLLELPTREGGDEGKERVESKDGEEKEGHDEDGRHDRGGTCNAGGGRGERLDGGREGDGVVDSREPGGVRGERREDGGAGRDLSHGHGRGRRRGEVAARRWWLDGRERPEHHTRSQLLDGGREQERQEAEGGACGDDGHGGVHVGGGGVGLLVREGRSALSLRGACGSGGGTAVVLRQATREKVVVLRYAFADVDAVVV